jgi:hypothetical protein
LLAKNAKAAQRAAFNSYEFSIKLDGILLSCLDDRVCGDPDESRWTVVLAGMPFRLSIGLRRCYGDFDLVGTLG